MKLDNEAIIKKDRLRFTKNKLSANLTLLAIVLNAFYFVNIYKSDVGNYYYRLIIGVSVIYNLLFMLMAFLSSEGVKNYKPGYSYVLLGLGLGQLIRVFILPRAARAATVLVNGEEERVMGSGQYSRVCIYLILSAVLCMAAGVVNLNKSTTLTRYQAELSRAGIKHPEANQEAE